MSEEKPQPMLPPESRSPEEQVSWRPNYNKSPAPDCRVGEECAVGGFWRHSRNEYRNDLLSAGEELGVLKAERDALKSKVSLADACCSQLIFERNDARTRAEQLSEQLTTARERGRVAEHALTLAKGTIERLKLDFANAADLGRKLEAQWRTAADERDQHVTLYVEADDERKALKARVELLEGALRSECDAFDYHVETGGKTQPGYTQEVWQRNRDAVRGLSPESCLSRLFQDDRWGRCTRKVPHPGEPHIDPTGRAWASEPGDWEDAALRGGE